jgi:hypothetical protein
MCPLLGYRLSTEHWRRSVGHVIWWGTAGLEGDLSVFRELQLCCGFTDREAAAYCGVSLRTWRRWRRDQRPSMAALKLLAIRAGAMPWPDWSGWEVHSGHMFPPGQSIKGFGPGHVLVVTFLHAQIAELRKQVGQQVAEGDSKARAV